MLTRTLQIGGFVVVLAPGILPLLDAAPDNRWEIGGEWVAASDVALAQLSGVGHATLAHWETAVSVAVNRVEIDYRPVPFDFQGVARSRGETAAALQINGRRTLNERWTLLAGGGASKGHSNYRSIWLDEYFHQQYSGLRSIPGFSCFSRASSPLVPRRRRPIVWATSWRTSR
ncbi:MAG TPA: hypothetical protein VGA56_10480 [Opitutaceae bacterium]